MTARCSRNILNVQTSIDILKTSARADVAGSTKIFEREIVEKEIVCRIQSFMMISAHHRVRQRLASLRSGDETARLAGIIATTQMALSGQKVTNEIINIVMVEPMDDAA
jgi:hypothetical protein